MKYRSLPCASLLLAAFVAHGQAPIIRTADMFNQAGQYYLAYDNAYDSANPTSAYVVTGLIKSAGPDKLWDFGDGPTDVVNRYDYLDPAGVYEATDFPEATLVERKTVEGLGEEEFLFFDHVETEGRKVHGFNSASLSPDAPAVALIPPIVDFPETIEYGDGWANQFSYTFAYFFIDPESSSSFDTRLDVVSQFNVDAWGQAFLPEIGLVDVLRVNEVKTEDIWFDFAIEPDSPPQWTYAGTAYTRIYRWLSPGRGIVVQIASESTMEPQPPDPEFTFAAVFERMFETNKEPEPVDDTPKPAPDLQVQLSNGSVVIRWGKAVNASRYRVEYSNGGLSPDDWQPLGEETADQIAIDPDGMTNAVRFYRVVSIR